MVEIQVYTDENNMLKGFECLGHANYAPAGQDIVCAYVSGSIQMACSALAFICDTDISLNAETGNVRAISKPRTTMNRVAVHEVLSGLFDTFGEQLKGSIYENYITISKTEGEVWTQKT
jgi:uncharacterized protein YsxB (DUF464 family)